MFEITTITLLRMIAVLFTAGIIGGVIGTIGIYSFFWLLEWNDRKAIKIIQDMFRQKEK